MPNTSEMLSLNSFPIFVITASFLAFLFMWISGRVEGGKSRVFWGLGSVILIGMMFVSGSQIKKPIVEPLIQKTAAPGKALFGKQASGNIAYCATGKATGSSATNMIPVADLPRDGQTDAYPAIQKAIEDAGKAGGGIVKLPEGTFVINGHIHMRNNVVLEGAGPKTILKAGPKFLQNKRDQSYSVVFAHKANNVTLRNFTADQQGQVLDGKSIDRFWGFTIYALDTKNFLVHDVYVRNPFAFSMMVENSNQFCFYNNNTQVGTSGKYDQLDGIHVLNSSYGDVTNNYIDQGFADDGDDGLAAHTIDGVTHDVTFAYNTVRGGKGGAGMQLALTNKEDAIFNIKIQNNEFWGSPRGIRTGYYGEPGGSVHDVVIGGSRETGNYIHDNIFNNVTKEDVVNIYGNGIDPFNITVSHNHHCKAGIISVGKGDNNVVSDNVECKL